MLDSDILPSAHIPVLSQEVLWEWDMPSDSLFLTEGAVKALHLKVVPANMADFYSLLPANAAIELAALREDIINGRADASQSCGYICNGYWVQERMTVLLRNAEGRAVRIMGQMKISPLKDTVGFVSGQSLLSEAGMWLYDVTRGLLWRDAVCDSILGHSRRLNYPIASRETLFSVHPSEQEAVKRHYALFCTSNFLGDTITDVLRVSREDGQYIPILVRATAMQRDKNGRALLISGIMASGEASKGSSGSSHRDGHLFNALDSMGSGQWNWDTRQKAIYFCPRYLNMLGYTAEDEQRFSQNWRSYIHPDDLEKVTRVQNQIICGTENGDAYECAYRIRRADGGWAWVFDRGCVTWRDADGRAGHMIGSITNITTAQAERDKLEELVRHDSLTGLRSRAYCNLEIEHIEQNKIRPVSIISVDLTGLKMINDYLGHSKGDEVLTATASIMRSTLRRSDCIARIGGDEFLILLPGCDEIRGHRVLDKLRKAFTEYNAARPPLPVFVAIGLAVANTMENSLKDTVVIADEQMYEDKRSRRKEEHTIIKQLILERTGHVVGRDERLFED